MAEVGRQYKHETKERRKNLKKLINQTQNPENVYIQLEKSQYIKVIPEKRFRD